MSKTVIIAEKPSVAQDIVRALTPVAGKFDKQPEHFENDAYVVTSAVGHLVEIKAPEEYEVKRGKWSFAHLPVVPPHFDLAPIDKAKTRLNAVVKLVKRKDVTRLIKPDVMLWHGGFAMREPGDPFCDRGSRCIRVIAAVNNGDDVILHSVVDLMSDRVVYPDYVPSGRKAAHLSLEH